MLPAHAPFTAITAAAGEAGPPVSVLRRRLAARPGDGSAHHDLAAHALVRDAVGEALLSVRRRLAVGSLEASGQRLYALALLRLADERNDVLWRGPRPWRAALAGESGDERHVAEMLLSRLSERYVDDATLFLSLGAARLALSRVADALAAFRRATALEPGYLEALNNLGATHAERFDRGAGATWLRRGLSVQPGYAEGWNNLASLLLHAGVPREAAAAAEQALRCRPDWAEPRWNLALATLAVGDLERGFQLYEVRFGLERDRFAPPIDNPWDGAGPGPGEAILVRAEQGYGDMLQFARYLPALADRGFRVILECHPALDRLLAKAAGVSRTVPIDDIPAGLRQVAMASLPHLLGTRLETVPADVPYLEAPATLADDWRHRLQGLPRPLVGLCWQGNPDFRRDRERSPGFAVVSPLLAHRPASFIGLVREPDAGALADRRLVHFGPGFADFADTAACMAALDLVITSDTATAHLAGALAKPTFLLLHHAPDWRWLEDRSDSPWYPTMRLFRQPAPDDWQSVINAVRMAIGT